MRSLPGRGEVVDLSLSNGLNLLATSLGAEAGLFDGLSGDGGGQKNAGKSFSATRLPANPMGHALTLVDGT